MSPQKRELVKEMEGLEYVGRIEAIMKHKDEILKLRFEDVNKLASVIRAAMHGCGASCNGCAAT